MSIHLQRNVLKLIPRCGTSLSLTLNRLPRNCNGRLWIMSMVALLRVWLWLIWAIRICGRLTVLPMVLMVRLKMKLRLRNFIRRLLNALSKSSTVRLINSTNLSPHFGTLLLLGDLRRFGVSNSMRVRTGGNGITLLLS